MSYHQYLVESRFWLPKRHYLQAVSAINEADIIPEQETVFHALEEVNMELIIDERDEATEIRFTDSKQHRMCEDVLSCIAPWIDPTV